MKVITFSSPVDASHYVAGFGLAKGIALKSTDYDANVYRFSLVRPDDSVASQVNGVNPADLTPGALVDEDNAGTDVRAAIAATIPSP
jgi:hypothetical protein